MFLHSYSKQISTRLQSQSSLIKSGLYRAFETSILGCSNELLFFRTLIKELANFFNNLTLPGMHISARYAETHQKPIVLWNHSRCELGDLLAVVKYHHPSGDCEAKSIIYQVKLSGTNSYNCVINQNQLDLLCKWPSFFFGKASTGGPKSYRVIPRSLEFGSFMLEPRNARRGVYLPGKYFCYGICPHALLVRQVGPKTVDIAAHLYTRGDAST